MTQNLLHDTQPEKYKFYSNLVNEDNTDGRYIHAKRICKYFETKSSGEYHYSYLKSDTLLLGDLFENLGLKIII